MNFLSFFFFKAAPVACPRLGVQWKLHLQAYATATVMPDPSHSSSLHHRCGSDPQLLWLWFRPEAAAPIGLPAWGLPPTSGVALKQANKPKKAN